MSAPSAYVLIAISNLNRAASFRQAVADTLHLDTVVVRDGDDALQEMARRGLPSLLIVDLSLPRVDGFAVVRRVRRQGSDRSLRIIVVAAHESLLSAARELSDSLAISAILSIDADQAQLRETLLADAPPPPRRAAQAEPAHATHSSPGKDVDSVIERAAIDARRRFQMPVSIGYVKVGDQEHMSFHVTARGGEPALPTGDAADITVLRQVAESLDPLIIPDVETHPVFSNKNGKSSPPIRGFAAVPVTCTREDVHAALCVLDTRPLSLNAGDIDAFAGFARNVGQEIDRVLSPVTEPRAHIDLIVEDVKALQHLAATDPLTGLANRRGGEKHIASEISRAKREKRPLSCILLDIDRFKQVNDTYGHQAGDQILRDVSSLLRRTVRAYDILVRWGGEEFLLVLPGVDLAAARALADRVRSAVETLDTHGIGRVTISAGAASFESDYDFALALKTADQRLYQAKASGRNAVV
jgi:diguanylate cyclase (GGDEF)-like protein